MAYGSALYAKLSAAVRMAEAGSASIFSYYVEVFFASINSQKLQEKMEKIASPFWRRLQPVQQDYLGQPDRTADIIVCYSTAGSVPGDRRYFCKSC